MTEVESVRSVAGERATDMDADAAWPGPRARVGVAPLVLVAGFAGVLGDGLRSLLASQCGLRLVGKATGDVACDLQRWRPECALVSYEALKGAAEVRRLAVAHPETALVLLSVYATTGQLNHLRAAGARAALGTEIAAHDLVGVLCEVRGAGLVAGHSAARRGVLAALTAREQQVLELLELAYPLAQVASTLGIALETARDHAQNLYRKLGVGGRRELTGRPAPRYAKRVAAGLMPAAALAFRRHTPRSVAGWGERGW